MKKGWAGLVSGGKDSILAVQKAMDAGLRVTYLVCVRPDNPDSYMFHSANLDAVRLMAERGGMEYVEIKTPGEKEVEISDLETGLSGLPLEGVITGAVESVYQKERIERVAERLSLRVFSPLWQMDPLALISEVALHMDAIIVVCAADGLDESFLGEHFSPELTERLKRVAAKRHIHLAGEGGEYESLVLNAPFFSAPITYRSSEIISGGGRCMLRLGGFS